MKSLMAIDPGASGGIAWTEDGEVFCSPMPEGMTEQADFLRSCRVRLIISSCLMEQVGSYMPGNSGPAAATFARHCGHLEAICYCLDIPTEKVLPKKWMSAIGTLPKDKQARKKAIREAMARKYPHLKVTLKTADALGILTYGLKAATDSAAISEK